MNSLEEIVLQPTGISVSSLRFDHLGLVVEEIGSGRDFLVGALGVQRWSEVIPDPQLGVSVQFGLGNSGPCFELVAPLGDRSPIRGALRGRGNILHHVAYLTDRLESQGDRMRSMGCVATGDPRPAVAYGGHMVQFWVSPLRFIVELVEAPEHEHVYRLLGV